MLAWTFFSEDLGNSAKHRANINAPRRVGIRIAEYLDEQKFAKALTFARPGAPLDVLLCN
jgi:hypothetical protein